MKPKHILLLNVITLVSVSTLPAQVIFTDGFGSYADDAALTAVWPRVTGTASDIFLSIDPSDAGNATIQEATTAGRLRYTISGGLVPTDVNPVVFSFDLYDTLGAVGTSGRAYAEIRDSGVATGLMAAGVYNSVNTGTLNVNKYQARNLDNGLWIQLDADRSVGWHSFRFVIRGNTADLYVDNVLEPNFSNRPWAGGISYDWLNLGSGLTGNTPVHFDNVYLAVVPEPSSLALLGLGGFGLALVLLRRRK